MSDETLSLSCAIGSPTYGERVTLAHGEGGRMMRRLLN